MSSSTGGVASIAIASDVVGVAEDDARAGGDFEMAGRWGIMVSSVRSSSSETELVIWR